MVLNDVQHIFPGGKNVSRGDLSPCAPLVTGLATKKFVPPSLTVSHYVFNKTAFFHCYRLYFIRALRHDVNKVKCNF